MSKLNISRDFERKVKNYYSKNYVVHSHSSFIFRLRRLRVLEQIRKRKSQMCFDDVLEVGGGPKILYQCVLEKCKKYYALDITKANLELIEKESTKVSPIHSDLDRYTPNDQFFDFILAIGVLEYTHYPLENLKKLIGLLKSNGIIICSLPNRLSPYRIWSSYIYQPISYILRLLLRKENFYYKRKLVNPYFVKKELNKISGLSLNCFGFGMKLIPCPADRIMSKVDLEIIKHFEKCHTRFFRFLYSEYIFILQRE